VHRRARLASLASEGDRFTTQQRLCGAYHSEVASEMMLAHPPRQHRAAYFGLRREEIKPAVRIPTHLRYLRPTAAFRREGIPCRQGHFPARHQPLPLAERPSKMACSSLSCLCRAGVRPASEGGALRLL